MVSEDRSAKRILIVKTGTTFPSIREAWGDFEGYIDNCTDELVARCTHPSALKSEVVDAPESRRLLTRFVELVRGSSD